MNLRETITSHPAWNTTAIHQAILNHAAQQPAKNKIDVYEEATAILIGLRTEALNTGDTTTADHRAETIVLLQEPKALTYAHKFHRIGKHRDEYRAAAHAGLWHAIATYEPGRGSFYRWSARKVRNALLEAIRDQEHQTISHHDFQHRGPILKAAEQEPAATTADIAATTRQRPDTITRILTAATIESLEANPVEPPAIVKVQQQVEDHEEQIQLLRQAAACLTPDQIDLLARLFGIGEHDASSAYKVARELGVPLKEISARHRDALRTLRAAQLGAAIGAPAVRPADPAPEPWQVGPTTVRLIDLDGITQDWNLDTANLLADPTTVGDYARTLHRAAGPDFVSEWAAATHTLLCAGMTGQPARLSHYARLHWAPVSADCSPA